jgi:DNA-binding CsgD family transcriptional regulator
MTAPATTPFQTVFNELCIGSATPDYDHYISTIRQAAPFPTLDGGDMVFVLFDHHQQQLRYCSDTYALFGYRDSDPTETNTFSSRLARQQADYPYRAAAWHHELFGQVAPTDKVNARCYHCGIQVHRPDGRTMHILARAHTVAHNHDLNPAVTLTILQDISHLYKGDHYWMRATFGEQNQLVYYVRSEEPETVAGDILSEREKQVLNLLRRGEASVAIGRVLGISKTTVDKHRQNMLARTGARDTTALLQLAQWCNLF